MMKYLPLALMAVALSACHSQKSVVPPAKDVAVFEAYHNSPGPAALPQAHIYRTNVDVDANVPVTINPADGTLISYPAPGDINGATMPVVLRDGWLLDRRGVSANTRFLRYTYSQYAALLEAPSPAELLEAILPDARVTEIVALPFKTGAVTPEQAETLIKGGLPGCEVIYQIPTVRVDK